MPRRESLTDDQIDAMIELLSMFMKYGDPAFTPALFSVIQLLRKVRI